MINSFIRASLVFLFTLPLFGQYTIPEEPVEHEKEQHPLEKSPWDFVVGLSGTDSLNSAAGAETFYWGPYGRIGYEINEPMKARLGVRNTQDKFLYDGLGGVVKQSTTGISPGFSWDVTDIVSLDFEYTYRFGQYSYHEHAPTVSVDVNPSKMLRFGLMGNATVQNYDFPTTDQKVTQRGYSAILDGALILSRRLEFPLVGSWYTSKYSTSKTSYTARTISPGVTLSTEDRRWSATADVILGSDSSEYSILGAEARLRYRPLDQIMIRLSYSYSTYSFQGGVAGKNRKAQGEAVSPFGNSESYYLQAIGLDVSYTFH
jgi:opacity protein-like surface antigen